MDCTKLDINDQQIRLQKLKIKRKFQTCTHCGMLTKMKGCEVYNCKNCNFTSDRDLNRAKNIFLKHHKPENFLMNQCKYKLMLQKNKNLHYGCRLQVLMQSV